MHIYNTSAHFRFILLTTVLTVIGFQISRAGCPTPTVSASGPLTFCTGGSVTLTASSGSSFLWSNSAVTQSITVSSSGSFSVQVTDSTGCTDTSAVTIVQVDQPVSSTITNLNIPLEACEGNIVNITCDAVTNGTQYNWYVQGFDTFNLVTNGPLLIDTLGALHPLATGWQICVYASNSCPQVSNTRCETIRGNLSAATFINGNSFVCGPVTLNYLSDTIQGTLDYEWTSSTPEMIVSGNDDTVSVTFTSAFTTGILCVHGRLTCGSIGPDKCITISNQPTTPSNITGATVVCPGSSYTYSINSSGNASSYNWVLQPAGAGIITNIADTSVSIAFDSAFSGSAVVNVVSVSSCNGVSDTSYISVTSGILIQPTSITGAGNGQCGQTTTYTCTPVSGAIDYTWSVTNGAPGSFTGGNSHTVVWNGSGVTGSISVHANNSCGAGFDRTRTIRLIPAVPALTINGSDSVSSGCNNTIWTFSIDTTEGATNYNWSVPVGVIISGAGTNSITVDFAGAALGNFVITVQPSNACGNTNTRSKTINVSACIPVGISNLTSEDKTLTIIPNPAHQLATLQWNDTQNGLAKISVKDITGREVLLKNFSAQKGKNIASVDVTSFSKGLYIVTIQLGNVQQAIKLMVD